MDLNFEKILQEHDADCLFVNTFDEFLSEYTEKKDNLLFQITGFEGSNGMALICKNKKCFFTDGRYLIQAKNQISSEFEIMHINNFYDLFTSLKISKILLDEKRFSMQFCLNFQKKYNVKFLHWKHEVALPFKNKSNFYKLPEILLGENSEEKLAKVRKHLKEKNADCFYVTDCQNICWILNIRGNDEDFTPVYKKHLIITQNDFKFEIDLETTHCKKILVDFQINFETYKKISCTKEFSNFITQLKAIKNNVEIEGIENGHKIDGKFLTNFLQNLEQNYTNLTEFDVGVELLNARKQSDCFVSPSFPSICGHNENGAIIHYTAKKENAKVINDGVLLIDSGGQYCGEENGKKVLATTDVTRTVYLGKNPSVEYQKVFTLVLKGHIAVATANFTEGTTGKEIDILARKFLLENGYNYDHGTGHGVGAFLSVHEAGVGISPQNETTLREGMLISNEPGCYLEGKFGVRIESLVLVVKKENGMLGFKTITLVPIQEKSINFEMLTDFEQNWVKDYNKLCWKNAKC